MPELPEVETVRAGLAAVKNHKIVGVFGSGKSLRLGSSIPVKRMSRLMVGGRFQEASRIGKYLLLDVGGMEPRLLVHLGMSGRFRIFSERSEMPPHTHVWWDLEYRNSKSRLCFSDPRRFGVVDLTKDKGLRSHSLLKNLGRDPILETVDDAYLMPLLKKSKRAVKTFLLDQRVIAGIGNIYASEALWLAKIRPTTRCSSLNGIQVKRLATSIGSVLDHALDKGGTTLKDFVYADGKTGGYAGYLRVYGRGGEPCLGRGCRGEIKKTVLHGRSTFHCPACVGR